MSAANSKIIVTLQESKVIDVYRIIQVLNAKTLGDALAVGILKIQESTQTIVNAVDIGHEYLAIYLPLATIR